MQCRLRWWRLWRLRIWFTSWQRLWLWLWEQWWRGEHQEPRCAVHAPSTVATALHHKSFSQLKVVPEVDAPVVEPVGSDLI